MPKCFAIVGVNVAVSFFEAVMILRRRKSLSRVYRIWLIVADYFDSVDRCRDNSESVNSRQESKVVDQKDTDSNMVENPENFPDSLDCSAGMEIV